MRLSDVTTLRIGGPVDTFIEGSLEDILPKIEGDLLVLGGGSNILAADEGFSGTVVRDSSREVAELGGSQFRVDAGVVWDDFVAYSVDRDLSGLESLSGIPGSVGAAPVQNIGAYGADVAATVVAVRAWDRDINEAVRLSRADLKMAYRDSILKRSARSQKWGPTGRWVILSVDFELMHSAYGFVRYAELAKKLDVPVGGQAKISDIRDAVLGLRRSKGMVLDQTDHDTWSAGSFFTNPVVTRAPDGAPAFQTDGGIKVSAAWLIEQAGFPKGFSMGGQVALSSRHSLAITNRGGGTAHEVLEMARRIRSRVKELYSIELQPEPIFVGCQL